MRKFFALSGSVVVGLLLFAAIIGVAGLENILKAFSQLSFKYLFAFLAASFAINILSAYKWRLILSEQGYKINLFRLMMYRNGAFSVSYITPFVRLGGEPLKVLVLKKHGIPTTQAVASAFLDKSLEIVMDVAIVCVLAFAVLAGFAVPSGVRNVLVAVILVMLAFLLLFYFTSFTRSFLSVAMLVVPRKGFLGRLRAKILEIDSATNDFLKSKRSCLVKLLAVSVVQWLALFLEFRFAALIIGYDASFVQLMLIMLVTGFVSVIPVPAALGVLEAGQFSLFAALGLGPHLGIALSLVIRLKDTLWTLLGFVFLSNEGIGLFRMWRSKRVRINKGL